jgi:hypothetical protein
MNSLNSYGGEKTSLKNFVENNVTLPTSLNILLSKQSKFHFFNKINLVCSIIFLIIDGLF